MSKSIIQLKISAFLLIIVALAYGFAPNKILHFLFDFKVETTDLKHVFKAIMCLYVGFSFYWLYACKYLHHLKAATFSCTLFMGSLVIGRLIGFFIDGIPSFTFVIGFIVEAILCSLGIINLMKQKVAQ